MNWTNHKYCRRLGVGSSGHSSAPQKDPVPQTPGYKDWEKG